jgi:hypothetical protein
VLAWHSKEAKKIVSDRGT